MSHTPCRTFQRAAAALIVLLGLSACDSFRASPVSPHDGAPRTLQGTRLSLTPDGLLLASPGSSGVAAVQIQAAQQTDVLFLAEPGPGALVATWESYSAAAVFQSEPTSAAHQLTLDLHGVTAPSVNVRLLNGGGVVAAVEVSPDSTIVLGTSTDELTSFHVVRLADGTTVIRVDTEQQPMGGAYVTSSLFGVVGAFVTDIEVVLEGLGGGASAVRIEAPREVLLLQTHAR
jgi:hypothetical protein